MEVYNELNLYKINQTHTIHNRRTLWQQENLHITKQQKDFIITD